MFSGVKFNSKTLLISSPWPKNASEGLKIEVFKNLQSSGLLSTFYQKTSILRHLEAFLGHSEENKKVLELNFTPENGAGCED